MKKQIKIDSEGKIRTLLNDPHISSDFQSRSSMRYMLNNNYEFFIIQNQFNNKFNILEVIGEGKAYASLCTAELPQNVVDILLHTY